MEEKITPQRSKNTDIIIMLLVVIAMAVYYYGPRVLIVAVCAIICSAVADYLSVRLNGAQRWMINDFSQIITALILTCLLPASVPYWLSGVAAAIAVIIAKLPFGGFGKNIFNPAAVAYAFVAICWPAKVLMYPRPFMTLPLDPDITSGLVNAPSYTLSMGGVPRMEILEAVLGEFAGPAGASCVIVILMCGIYMMIRKTISRRATLSALLTVVLIAAVFPRTTADALTSVINELFSGVIVFMIVFMANDPVTLPKTSKGEVMYGVCLGVLSMIFRHFGESEIGCVYALLLVNPFKNKFDEWSKQLSDAVCRAAGYIARSVKANSKNRKRKAQKKQI